MSVVMREHPSWMPQPDGTAHRVSQVGNAVWHLAATAEHMTTDRLRGTAPAPGCDTFTVPPAAETGMPPSLHGALAGLGAVRRVRNPDLWDAIGTAIIRQVIRAGQSKLLYRRFCAAHGRPVAAATEAGCLFPTPETVLALSAEQFSVLGMAFKRRPLRAAAAAYVEYGHKWAALEPSALVGELRAVYRIGPWTAGAAVADYTHDWSLYPYGDLAVRKWATRAAPEMTWPSDEAGFARLWRELAGDHLSTLTVLTLAWGGQHGEIG